MERKAMKIHKKLFKYGGSRAVALPVEFTKRLHSDEVAIEMSINEYGQAVLTMQPVEPLDTLEADPNFALFIQAIYRDAIKHPE